MKTISIKGTVVSGKQEASKFTKLPWVKKQIAEKLGFTPYNGTLNIRLTKEDRTRLKETLKKAKPIEIVPAEGYYRGRCFKAILMNNLECVIVAPEVTDYPEDTVEIIASTNLREKLRLKDGDTVVVKVLI